VTVFEPQDVLYSDEEFDSVYDSKIRALSEQHWTPVRVASRAAKILTLAGATRILDVGAGVGKFCIVGALVTDAEFVGVERRAHLVDIARGAAARHRAPRVSFVHGNIETFPFEGFDGIYLYNPFFEQISYYAEQIDGATERSPTLHAQFVTATREKLVALASRVAVVTYHGFGGRMPPEYSLVGDEPAGNDRLELWIKE
jgi:SAM-dependent methyltransferase